MCSQMLSCITRQSVHVPNPGGGEALDCQSDRLAPGSLRNDVLDSKMCFIATILSKAPAEESGSWQLALAVFERLQTATVLLGYYKKATKFLLEGTNVER